MIDDTALAALLDREGPETDDPLDAGGRTKFGIAEASNPDLWRNGPPTKEQALARYRRDYVAKPGIDQLPTPLDVNVFDFGVTSGPGRAVKLLQSLLHVPRDGQIGPQTLAALQGRDVKTLNNLYCAAREAFYRDIVRNNPTQQRFLNGWVRRAKKFFLA